MPTRVQTARERVERIEAAIAKLTTARRYNLAADVLSAQRIAEGVDPGAISTEVNAILDLAEASADAAKADIDAMFWSYQERVKVGCPGAFASAGLSGTTITAVGGLPFSVFATGDKLIATNAEDAANKIPLTVATVVGGGSSMTVVESLTTNTTDTKLSLTMLEEA